MTFGSDRRRAAGGMLMPPGFQLVAWDIGSGQTEIEWPAVDLGRASPNRAHILVQGQKEGSAAASFTVGGVTPDLQVEGSFSGGSLYNRISTIEGLTGTIADVEVTGAPLPFVGWALFAAYGLVDVEPFDTDTASGNNFSASLNIPENGFAIANGMSQRSSGNWVQWSCGAAGPMAAVNGYSISATTSNPPPITWSGVNEVAAHSFQDSIANNQGGGSFASWQLME